MSGGSVVTIYIKDNDGEICLHRGKVPGMCRI